MEAICIEIAFLFGVLAYLEQIVPQIVPQGVLRELFK